MTNRGRKYMMPSFNAILLAGAAAMLPLGAPAHASPEEAPTAEIVHPHDDSVIDVYSESYAEEQTAKMQRDMDQAMPPNENIFDTNNGRQTYREEVWE